MATNTSMSTVVDTSDGKALNDDQKFVGDKKTNDDRRPKLAALQTPTSAQYPSELRSPLVGTSNFVKKEDGIKTPITPPVAYLDFLKSMSMSSGLMSPVTGTSSKFNFGEKTSEKSFEEPLEKSFSTTTASQPALSRTASTDSAASVSTVETNSTSSSTSTEEVLRSASGNIEKTKPQSPRIIIPGTQFAKPLSAKPRGVYIPQSPLSPANVRSPMSARSLHEPYSASGLSATPWSADYSPVEADGTSRKSKVSVRQVVTRTVTYARTSLEPAPKGKRRKIEE